MLKVAHLTAYGKALKAAHSRKQSGRGFFDWIKGAATSVWDKAVKPGYQWVRDHPVTALAAGSKFIPGVGQYISPALGAVGVLTGKGRKRKTRRPKQAGGSLRTVKFI